MEVAIVLVLSWDMMVVDVVFDKTFSRHRPLTIGTMTALLLLESSSSPIWRWLFVWSSSIKKSRQICNLEVLLVGNLMFPFDILGVVVVLSFQNYCEISLSNILFAQGMQNLSFKYSKCSGYARG